MDEQCRPLRPAILYGIDSRADKEIQWLTRHYGRDVRRLFGHPICSGDTATKILWIKNNEPEVYRRTYKFLTGSSFITAKLTGRYVIDQFLAKGSFRPLYRADGTVNEEECGLYCRPDQIAACAYSTDVAGRVTREAAAQTGLAEGTPVICGTGDSTSEAISVGLTEPGTAFFQYGSSHVLLLLRGSYGAGLYILRRKRFCKRRKGIYHTRHVLPGGRHQRSRYTDPVGTGYLLWGRAGNGT